MIQAKSGVRGQARLLWTAAVIALLATSVFPKASSAKSTAESRDAKATAFCGENDQPETGLQGETPLVDMATLRSQEPYYCGVRVVGHSDIWNRGGNWQLSRSQHCAYVASVKATFVGVDPEDPVTTREPAGVAVIDVSDPTKPEPVGLLREPGALDSVETMDAVDAGKRHVLVAGDFTGTAMDVYDVSDCTKPKHMATWNWPANAHNITLSPNGNRVYGTGGNGIMVADITNMKKPKLVANMIIPQPDGSTSSSHEVHLSADETRIYAATGSAACLGTQCASTLAEAGGTSTILDNTPLLEGKKDPQSRLIGVGKAGGHSTVPATINGKPYLVGSMELGSCPGVWPGIIDISYEKRPKVVGEIKLEMNEVENCTPDRTMETLGPVGGNVSSHYYDVDNQFNTRLGVGTFMSAGLRIFDLRDPAHPTEIAYYHPGATPGTTLMNGGAHSTKIVYNDYTVDSCGGHVQYLPKTGRIWFTCHSGGFWVVELTADARRLARLPPIKG